MAITYYACTNRTVNNLAEFEYKVKRKHHYLYVDQEPV
jgi:hypothetical protein